MVSEIAQEFRNHGELNRIESPWSSYTRSSSSPTFIVAISAVVALPVASGKDDRGQHGADSRTMVIPIMEPGISLRPKVSAGLQIVKQVPRRLRRRAAQIPWHGIQL